MLQRVFAAFLVLGLSASSAMADDANCAARDAVVANLASKFSEGLTASGLQEFQNGSAIVEVWVSKTTGTFTVLLTNPEGLSCVVAAGSHWFEEDGATVGEEPTRGIGAPPARVYRAGLPY